MYRDFQHRRHMKHMLWWEPNHRAFQASFHTRVHGGTPACLVILLYSTEIPSKQTCHCHIQRWSVDFIGWMTGSSQSFQYDWFLSFCFPRWPQHLCHASEMVGCYTVALRCGHLAERTRKVVGSVHTGNTGERSCSNTASRIDLWSRWVIVGPNV